MVQNKRLDKVTRYLTPKQSVVHWLQEIQPYQSIYEYVQFLRGQPESEAPITKQTRQIDNAIREAMKGQPKEAVDRAVRRAVKDVVFLIKLQHQANYEVMLQERAWKLASAGLAESFGKLRIELYLRHIIVDLGEEMNFRMPYPLEPEMVETVKVALKNHVDTWESLEDEGTIQEWLWDYLIGRGEKELPTEAYDRPDNQPPIIKPDKEEELRSFFKDDKQFELFKAGKAYHYCLASVNDAEYDRYYQTILSDMQGLIDSGEIQDGYSVYLEDVPFSSSKMRR